MSIGTYQILTVLYKKDFGVFLGTPGEEKGILLPKKLVPKDCETGMELEVFLYKDSEDRIIATTKKPKLTLDELAVLEVKQITRIGAFLDWGMDKDLLLPFKEQQGTLQVGDRVLVGMYVDRSERLCATMKIYNRLSADSPYQPGDMVKGTVYSINSEMGVFIAVDNRYFGLLPNQQVFAKYRIGDETELRVVSVREDGKLNLGTGKVAYQQMEDDAQKVLQVIDSFDGELPFGEKVSPEIIKREFSMSKAAFKRAIGRLYKEGKIELSENSIRRK